MIPLWFIAKLSLKQGRDKCRTSSHTRRNFIASLSIGLSAFMRLFPFTRKNIADTDEGIEVTSLNGESSTLLEVLQAGGF